MEKIVINKLGPITYCSLLINDFMVFTGPQASGKSTIAKSIFFFKNIKNLILMQIRKKLFSDDNAMKSSVDNNLLKENLIKEIRANFLQTFGATWCMDDDMYIEYYYTDTVFIKISLKEYRVSPNYIWIDLSEKLTHFLNEYDNIQHDVLTTHSPYILGTINNMLYADKISKEVDKNHLEKIIDPMKWLEFDKMSAYYVVSGVIKSCLDKDFKSIENEVIDGASDEINTEYEKMADLRYNSKMGVK